MLWMDCYNGNICGVGGGSCYILSIHHYISCTSLAAFHLHNHFKFTMNAYEWIFLLLLIPGIFTNEDNTKIYKCVIESCSGWRLNKVLITIWTSFDKNCCFSFPKSKHSSMKTLRRNMYRHHLRKSLEEILKLSFTQNQED